MRVEKVMSNTVQISARISKTTQKRVDRFVRSRGMKKSHLIEQALLHYIEALDVLPEYANIPKCVILSDEGWNKVVERLENPQPATPDLEELMRGD